MTTIKSLLDAGPTLSFEFFPPKTPKAEVRLRETLDRLEACKPDFVSVTYGAGGTTRDTTRDLVVGMCAERPFPAMPHLTCVGHTRAEVNELIDDYRANGVDNVLALAGDPQPEVEGVSEYTYALDLVEEIRTRTDMSIGVAAFPEVHPRSASRDDDRRHLAAKLEAADFGITQFFFDAADYRQMVDELTALGCDTPVLPGVIPVMNPVSVKRFADMNGTATPDDLWNRVAAADDPDDRLEIAVEAASALAAELLEGGAPGLHLYTLNEPTAVARICENVAWPRRG